MSLLGDLLGTFTEAAPYALQGGMRGLLAGEQARIAYEQKKQQDELRRLQLAQLARQKELDRLAKEQQTQQNTARVLLQRMEGDFRNPDKLADWERLGLLPMYDRTRNHLYEVLGGTRDLKDVDAGWYLAGGEEPGGPRRGPGPDITGLLSPDPGPLRGPLGSAPGGGTSRFELVSPPMEGSVLADALLRGEPYPRAELPQRVVSPAIPGSLRGPLGSAPGGGTSPRFTPSAKTAALIGAQGAAAAANQARVPLFGAQTERLKGQEGRDKEYFPIKKEEGRARVSDTKSRTKARDTKLGPEVANIQARTGLADEQKKTSQHLRGYRDRTATVAERNASVNEARQAFTEYRYFDTGQELNQAKIKKALTEAKKASEGMSPGDKNTWNANMKILTQGAPQGVNKQWKFAHPDEARERARKSQITLSKKYGLDPTPFALEGEKVGFAPAPSTPKTRVPTTDPDYALLQKWHRAGRFNELMSRPELTNPTLRRKAKDFWLDQEKKPWN